MKIKRYVATTMREALAQVRDEQGADAVIISNRRIEGGVELITAVDYDERDMAQAIAGAAAIRAETPPAVVPAPVIASRAEPTRAVAAAGVPRMELAATQSPEILEMRREVTALRELLEQQLASLAWSDQLRREPLRAQVLKELSCLGLTPDVARALAEAMPELTRRHESWRIPLALLLKYLPTADDAVLTRGGVYAVLGPTGVGKTTTIAKLAARYALKHGANSVALVSLDHHRIGARDQLLTFARILGVPLHVAQTAQELGAVLAGLGDRSLVLIDTAGMSPRDERLASQVAALDAAGRPVRRLLAVAANAEHGSLEDIVNAFAKARPEAVVLTKLDEAASLGPALSVVLRHALPFMYLSNGQRVPDDLHGADAKRIWIVRQAHKLARRQVAGSVVDEQYMAEHFGRQAANG